MRGDGQRSPAKNCSRFDGVTTHDSRRHQCGKPDRDPVRITTWLAGYRRQLPPPSRGGKSADIFHRPARGMIGLRASCASLDAIRTLRAHSTSVYVRVAVLWGLVVLLHHGHLVRGVGRPRGLRSGWNGIPRSCEHGSAIVVRFSDLRCVQSRLRYCTTRWAAVAHRCWCSTR